MDQWVSSFNFEIKYISWHAHQKEKNRRMEHTEWVYPVIVSFGCDTRKNYNYLVVHPTVKNNTSSSTVVNSLIIYEWGILFLKSDTIARCGGLVSHHDLTILSNCSLYRSTQHNGDPGRWPLRPSRAIIHTHKWCFGALRYRWWNEQAHNRDPW